MIRKTIITFAFALLLFFLVFPQKGAIISVFQMTDEPLVISKGNYGQSLILEVSFSHDGFLVWLNSLKQPYPLLMLDANWINRSPQFIEAIEKKNIPTGLLGGNGGTDYTIELLKRDIAIYEKHFEEKPLWFMTADYKYTSELQQATFSEQINMISPTYLYKEGDKYPEEKGIIISIPLHEDSKPNFETLKEFMTSQKYLSIEENIFGYSMKTKKVPQ
nr:hypothetical protein [Lysinibacillus timonensis]